MDINEKVYLNVKALARINGIDMKDVETSIGHSVGYLSRKSTKISLEDLVKLSKVLEVSADELMYNDFQRELQRKIALEDLDSAFVKALEFFNGDALISRLQAKVIPEGDDQQ